MITWRKPDGGNEIDQYYISWNQLKHGRFESRGYSYIQHIPEKIHYNFTIAGIESGALYNIHVVAKNYAGQGNYLSNYVTTGSCIGLLNHVTFILFAFNKPSSKSKQKFIKNQSNSCNKRQYFLTLMATSSGQKINLNINALKINLLLKCYNKISQTNFKVLKMSFSMKNASTRLRSV